MIATSTAPKPRRCRVCRVPFVRSRPLQRACGWECAIKIPAIEAQKVARRAAKEDRKQTRQALRKLRPLSYWAKQAQQAFNAWCRWRDRNQPCISCGTMEGAFDAGHYRSVGACPELRFDEANVHRQCAMNCNHNKGGNVLEYRKGLIARIGQAEVDRLEGPHPPLQLRADDLRAIRDEYRARLKSDSSTA